MHRFSRRSIAVGTIMLDRLSHTEGLTIVFLPLRCRFLERLPLLSIIMGLIDSCLVSGSRRLAPSYG